MLLQRNFLVLIAVEAITGRREARGKGETGTKYKELVPSFFWLSGLWRGEGRGGDGQGRAN